MREMAWCDEEAGGKSDVQVISRAPGESGVTIRSIPCPSCGHIIELDSQTGIIHDLPGLPAGVRFDPSDQEILEHLEAKLVADAGKLHPFIDEFIPTLDGDSGICYTHPEKLPGVSKDGQVRHFFHRPSKAYTTGTRKRRKVHSDEDGSETRWHKTGKTRPVLINGTVKGFKKILVLYTNYGRQKKPEKTNWVIHQYHLGKDEEEKDGEVVVSKVFYQTQPRQCGSSTTKDDADHISQRGGVIRDGFAAISTNIVECYGNQAYYRASFDHSQQQLIPSFDVHGDGPSSLLHFTQMIPERERFANDRQTDGTAR